MEINEKEINEYKKYDYYHYSQTTKANVHMKKYVFLNGAVHFVLVGGKKIKNKATLL